jgi:hypothetical protein
MHDCLTHATTGLKPISYWDRLLSTLIHESLHRTRLNTHSAIKVYWNATEPLLYVSHILIFQYFPSTYLFQRRTTVHLPKYHTHSCKTQQEWFLLLSKELHWARLYIYISVQQATKGIVSTKYSDALLITIPHVILVFSNQKCQGTIRYNGVLLTIRLWVSLFQITNNKPITYK